MKSLKNVLLAAGLVVSTMGMSLSANAVIIQQDIYLDVVDEVWDDSGHGLTQSLSQLIGSVMYNPADADQNNEIVAADVSFEMYIGGLTLTEADLLTGGSPLILLSQNFLVDGIKSLIGDIDFMLNGFALELSFEADPSFSGYFELFEDNLFSVVGETRLGAVNVSEPSALIIMLAGMGFLVRRKIAAK